LPGIGPVTAEKIIQYRENQLFTRIDEIQKVPGIGPATFDAIKNFLTVGE
jgi:competence protein ComEA